MPFSGDPPRDSAENLQRFSEVCIIYSFKEVFPFIGYCERWRSIRPFCKWEGAPCFLPSHNKNSRGSERGNSWVALTDKAKNGNLVPLSTFQHQVSFSCPASLSKSEQVSIASNCTQRQESLFRISNILNFSTTYTKSPFLCPLLDGALDFWCLMHFPVHCLITVSLEHSTYPISILLFVADHIAPKLVYGKI